MSRQEKITQLIDNNIKTLYRKVEDESINHNVPISAETHFKVTIIADEFNGMTKLMRHRKIYALLTEEFQSGLHALSLHLYTPAEWELYGEKTKNSPPCRGNKKLM